MARRNRGAQVGLFVFSQKTAPAGGEQLSRLGSDVFVVWDKDDPRTDVFLRAGVTLARALCVREQQQRAAQAADFSTLDEAILEVERRAKDLDELRGWTVTIQNNSEKIIKKLDVVRKSLEKQTDLLRDSIADLKASLAPDGEVESAA
jgi:hypothetical protein